MANYKIAQCTIADSDALSRNNIPAFWEDPYWVLAWSHTTLENHIAQVAKRMPRNLLNDRNIKRYQKAIDPATGRLVGYARWYLPLSHATTVDGTPTWPEAVVPAVEPEEEAEIRRIATTAIFNPNEDSDVLLVPIRLDYLAVHPENQESIALVQSGMREAEKLGLDIFIHAMKAGVGVYKRLGCYIIKNFVQDDSVYRGTGEFYIALMIYEQKSV